MVFSSHTWEAWRLIGLGWTHVKQSCSLIHILERIPLSILRWRRLKDIVLSSFSHRLPSWEGRHHGNVNISFQVKLKRREALEERSDFWSFGMQFLDFLSLTVSPEISACEVKNSMAWIIMDGYPYICISQLSYLGFLHLGFLGKWAYPGYGVHMCPTPWNIWVFKIISEY